MCIVYLIFTMNLIITEQLIDLLSDTKDHTVNDKHYKFLGKGGDGIIYLCDNKVIKIYKRFNMNLILKEFYVVGLLQELKNINRNVISIDRYYLALSHPVMVMEAMDGNLSEWCEKIINDKLSSPKD